MAFDLPEHLEIWTMRILRLHSTIPKKREPRSSSTPHTCFDCSLYAEYVQKLSAMASDPNNDVSIQCASTTP
jgi:hypothetical protein